MRILIFLIIDGEYCGEWILALIPIPQVIRQLNALFPGAQSVNSDVTMKVRWLSSADNDAWVFTYTTSMSESGGDRYGSALFNWAEVYRPTCNPSTMGPGLPTTIGAVSNLVSSLQKLAMLFLTTSSQRLSRPRRKSMRGTYTSGQVQNSKVKTIPSSSNR